MQISEERLPNAASGKSSSKGRFWNLWIRFEYFRGRFCPSRDATPKCDVIKSVNTDWVVSFPAGCCGWWWMCARQGSGVVCAVSVLYWRWDHQRAQTGGAIWSSLRPSPGMGMWQCGGIRGPLYDGCFWEVDGAQPQWAEPLNGPPMHRDIDERPLITHTKTHSCIHLDI